MHNRWIEERPVAVGPGPVVTAPMQGTIVAVAVAVAVTDGTRVARGDLVAVLEAMKMENRVLAHRDGTVRGLAVAPGDAVSVRSVLCEIDR